MGFIKRSSPVLSAAPSPAISSPTDVSHTSWKKLRRPLSVLSYSNDTNNSEDSNDNHQNSPITPTSPAFSSNTIPSAYSCDDIHNFNISVPRSRQSSSASLSTAFNSIPGMNSPRVPSPKKQFRRKNDSAPRENIGSSENQPPKRGFFSRHSKQQSLTVGTTDADQSLDQRSYTTSNLKKLSKHASMSFESKLGNSSYSPTNLRSHSSLGLISSPVSSTFVHHRHISKDYKVTYPITELAEIRRTPSSESFENLFSDDFNQHTEANTSTSPFPLPVSYTTASTTSRFSPGKSRPTFQLPMTPSTPNSINSRSQSPDLSNNQSLEEEEEGNGNTVDKKNVAPQKNHHVVEKRPISEKLHCSGNYSYGEDDDTYIVEGIDNSLGQWISISNADGITFPSFNTSSVSSGSARHSASNSVSSNFSFSQSACIQQTLQHLEGSRSRSTSQSSHVISCSSGLNSVNNNTSSLMPQPLHLHPGSVPEPVQLNHRRNGPSLVLQHSGSTTESIDSSSPYLAPPLTAVSIQTTPLTDYNASEYSCSLKSPTSFSTLEDDDSSRANGSYVTTFSKSQVETPKTGPTFDKEILPGKVQVTKSYGIVWIGEPEQDDFATTDHSLLKLLKNNNKPFGTEKQTLFGQSALEVSGSHCVGTPAPASPSSTRSSAASSSSASGTATPQAHSGFVSFNSSKSITAILETGNNLLNASPDIHHSGSLDSLSALSSSSGTTNSYNTTSNNTSNNNNAVNTSSSGSNYYTTPDSPLVDMSPLAYSSPLSSFYIWNDDAAHIFMDDDSTDHDNHNNVYSFHPNQHFLYQHPKSALDDSGSTPRSVCSSSPSNKNNDTTNTLESSPEQQQYGIHSNASSSLQPELKIEGSGSCSNKTETRQHLTSASLSSNNTADYELSSMFESKRLYVPQLTRGPSHRDARVL